jgi:hypothetical protein
MDKLTEDKMTTQKIVMFEDVSKAAQIINGISNTQEHAIENIKWMLDLLDTAYPMIAQQLCKVLQNEPENH